MNKKEKKLNNSTKVIHFIYQKVVLNSVKKHSKIWNKK